MSFRPPDCEQYDSADCTSEQIHLARTDAEKRAFARTVRGERHITLGELRHVLETTAQWDDRDQQPTIAERYRQQAAQLAELESI